MLRSVVATLILIRDGVMHRVTIPVQKRLKDAWLKDARLKDALCERANQK
jgi:hypothetical protein